MKTCSRCGSITHVVLMDVGEFIGAKICERCRASLDRWWSRRPPAPEETILVSIDGRSEPIRGSLRPVSHEVTYEEVFMDPAFTRQRSTAVVFFEFHADF